MSALTLRPYQTAAIEAVYDYLRHHDDDPCVVIPTGGGKTPIMATICRDAVIRWNGRVLILAHVKELLEQSHDKLRRICPEVPIGLYSAGLGKRDTDQPVVVAGIQSVYKKAGDLGPFDLILIDECHLLPLEGEGMYRSFLADARIVNPHVRVVGFTGTAFRMDSGPICRPDHFLNVICYEIGVKELIRDGYLCPLVSKAGQCRMETSGLKVSGSDFLAREVEELMDHEELVKAACREIIDLTANRRSILIFAAGVQHGLHVKRVLEEQHGVECGFICGETPIPERDELIARFRRDQAEGLFEREPLRFLCNVNVLSVGFDAPNVDCIALLRPTASPVLYCQAVGRGLRLHPDKQNCLILDFGGNVLRHGPIDQLQIKERKTDGTGEAPAKECPQCQSVIAAGYAACPDCGFVFPPPERNKHDAQASEEGVLSGEITDVEHEVLDIRYFVHSKRNAPKDHPKTMRVEYRIGLDAWVNEWVCLEHTGFARRKAEKWWRERSPDPIPETAELAVELAEAGALAYPEKITVRTITGDPFPQIIKCELGPKPDAIVSTNWDLDEVPF